MHELPVIKKCLFRSSFRFLQTCLAFYVCVSILIWVWLLLEGIYTSLFFCFLIQTPLGKHEQFLIFKFLSIQNGFVFKTIKEKVKKIIFEI